MPVPRIGVLKSIVCIGALILIGVLFLTTNSCQIKKKVTALEKAPALTERKFELARESSVPEAPAKAEPKDIVEAVSGLKGAIEAEGEKTRTTLTESMKQIVETRSIVVADAISKHIEELRSDINASNEEFKKRLESSSVRRRPVPPPEPRDREPDGEPAHEPRREEIVAGRFPFRKSYSIVETGRSGYVPPADPASSAEQSEEEYRPVVLGNVRLTGDFVLHEVPAGKPSRSYSAREVRAGKVSLLKRSQIYALVSLRGGGTTSFLVSESGEVDLPADTDSVRFYSDSSGFRVKVRK